MNGICNICCNPQSFDLNNNWPRDLTRCNNCCSSVRERAVKYILDKLYPDLLLPKIHESSPAGSLHKLLSSFPNYSYSFFFNNVENGQYNSENLLCANLECLPFEDNSFDLLLTMDVFEHIFNPLIALKEIYRVLKPGGYYIMTVPIENFNNPTEKTCLINENNVVTHIPTGISQSKNIKLEYHGNPIDASGSLVTYYYGYDLIDMINNETEFSCDVFFKNSQDDINELGILGVFKDVFVCKK